MPGYIVTLCISVGVRTVSTSGTGLHPAILPLMVCDNCKSAATLSSKIKDLSELKVGYAYVMDTGNWTGSFFSWVEDLQRRIDVFHNKCSSPMTCSCQHKIERLIRDIV